MSATDHPIVLLTSSFRAPSGIAGLADLAGRLGRELRILLRAPQRSEPSVNAHRVQMLRDDLPEELRGLTIDCLPSREAAQALSELGQRGGIVALVPSRRRGIARLIAHNDFERTLLDCQVPLLALPRDGALQPIRRVLFPADYAPRSVAALDQTIALCQALGAELHLLHVYGPDRLLPSEVDSAARNAAESPRDLYELDKRALQSLHDRAAAHIPTTSASAEGRAHEQAVRYAAEHQVDLIVMATHGPRSPEDIWQGTTTARVILASPVPVLAILA